MSPMRMGPGSFHGNMGTTKSDIQEIDQVYRLGPCLEKWPRESSQKSFEGKIKSLPRTEWLKQSFWEFLTGSIVCSEQEPIKNTQYIALAGATQLVEYNPVHQEVAGSNPDQSPCLKL